MTEVELQYNYCMQSVRRIAEIKTKDKSSWNEDDYLSMETNVDYLQQMLEKDFWTTQDLQPMKDAIK